jgi:hypothetical protein
VTPQDRSGVPGVAHLLGRGVYTGVPDDDVLDAIRGQRAVVTGSAGAVAELVPRLSVRLCDVTAVTCETGGSARRKNVLRRRHLRVRSCTELSWAVGIDHLEAVILRHIATGRVEVLNATALFLLSV